METESYKAVIERLYDLIADEKTKEISLILKNEEPHRVAGILDRLDSWAVSEVFLLASPELQSEIIVFAQPHTQASIVENLTDDQIFTFLDFNDEDDATDILQFVSEERREKILDQFGKSTREKIQTLLNFDADTAGGLMDTHYIIVKPSFIVEDVAEKIQNHFDANEQIPLVLVTSEHGVLLGYIPHRSLILQEPEGLVGDIVEDVEAVSVTIDQEDLVQTLQRSSNDFLVVTDEDRQPLGVVHVKDLLRVAQREATEDIYKFAGVHGAESPFETIQTKVRRRYKWLIINLGTAFLAAFVVSQFQGSIAQLAILAAFMPIVAGEGGNAATQALAVVVRGIATKDIAWSDARTVIAREAFAGVYNGLIVGSIAAVVAIAFGHNPLLGLVLGCAMVCNLFIAGLFGSLVPFVLKALNIDPATASSIFVTTATDIFGFMTFLGLATLILL